MTGVATARDPEKEATVQMTRKGKLSNSSRYPIENEPMMKFYCS